MTTLIAVFHSLSGSCFLSLFLLPLLMQLDQCEIATLSRGINHSDK